MQLKHILIAASVFSGVAIFFVAISLWSVTHQRILILFQTNSELRSLGGIIGGVATLNMDGTKISLENYHSNSDFPPKDDIQINNDEHGFNSRGSWHFIANASQAFSFSRTENLAHQHLCSAFPNECEKNFDGVVMFDPIFLGQLSETGNIGIDVNGKVLSGDNLSLYLLRDVYQEIKTNEEQNNAFNEIGNQLFHDVAKDFKSFNFTKLTQYYDLFKHSENIYISLKSPFLKQLNHEYAPKDDEIGTYFNEYTSSKIDSWAIYQFTKNEKSHEECEYTITVKNTLKPDVIIPENIQLFGLPRNSNIYPQGWFYQSVLFTLPTSVKDFTVETDGAPSRRGEFSSENQTRMETLNRRSVKQDFVVPPDSEVIIHLSVKLQPDKEAPKSTHPPLLSADEELMQVD